MNLSSSGSAPSDSVIQVFFAPTTTTQTTPWRGRLVWVWIVFAAWVAGIVWRLIQVSLTPPPSPNVLPPMIQRAIVLDRHGQVLASSLPTFSVYIHPHDIQDKQEAAIILGRLFPQLRGSKFIRDALHSKKKFVWLVRHLPPYEKNRITAYGLHGMGIIEDSQRVYP